jgi:hypothetical protein
MELIADPIGKYLYTDLKFTKLHQIVVAWYSFLGLLELTLIP